MSHATLGWSLAGWLFGRAEEPSAPRPDRSSSFPHANLVADDQAGRDADLVARLRQGDSDALRTLMQTYAGLLTDLVYTMVKDLATAEDIVQDAFVRVWTIRARLEIRDSVRAYLVQTARNLALNALRHERSQQRIGNILRQSAPPEGPTTLNAGEQRLLDSELNMAIEAAIQTLTPRVREAFLLHTDQGLRAPEIAAILGVAPATVHGWIYRANKQVAEHLRSWL